MAADWYFTADGKTRHGPFTLQEMQKRVEAGELKPAHMARRSGASTWVPAGTCPELFSAQDNQPLTASATRSTPPSPESTFSPHPHPSPPPAAAPVKKERSFGKTLLKGTVHSLQVVRLTLQATGNEIWRQVSLLRLRRRLRRDRLEQENAQVDLGVRLLKGNISVPGGEEAAERFRQLSQERQHAELASKSSKRTEVGALKSELRSLSVTFARLALDSNVPFEGRADEEARWKHHQGVIAEKEGRIAERVMQWKNAGPLIKRRVVAGFVGMMGLLLLASFLAWRTWEAKPNQPQQIASNGQRDEDDPYPSERSKSQAVEEKPTPVDIPRRRPTLQELFVLLSPSVPQVEAEYEEAGFRWGHSGSGILVKHQGKLFVVTNRHVIENSPLGVFVHFPLGKEKRYTIPSKNTKVVAIHRSADLALVDVTEARAEIEKLKIEPVILSPAGQRPKVGERVFAIGHPGDTEGEVLTSTLSDGIVSAVEVPLKGAHFLQITVALNPGNSGGPLFDAEGRVVGINTLKRVSRIVGRDIPLEAINFALDVEYLHELLTDAGKSLDAKAIEAVQIPPPAEATPGMKTTQEAKLKRLTDDGYKALSPSDLKSVTVKRLAPGQQRQFPVSCQNGSEYAVLVVSEGVEDITASVVNPNKAVVSQATFVNQSLELSFQANKEGLYAVVIENTTDTSAVVSITTLKK